jgi:hypothetical protein
MGQGDVTRIALLALVLASAACATPLGDAEALFRKGQYPATHQALLALDNERSSWTEPDQAEYALYFGLTLLALGDDGRARAWLTDAKAIDDAHPGSLRDRDRRRLDVALASNPVP